jgi:hypothetical protein
MIPISPLYQNSYPQAQPVGRFQFQHLSTANRWDRWAQQRRDAVTRSASAAPRRHVEQCAPRDTGGAAVATGAAEEAGESTDRRRGCFRGCYWSLMGNGV